MTWHWYIGREDEILLDLDSNRALWWAVQRLRRNLRREFLEAHAIHAYRTLAPEHYHMIVTLARAMPAMQRALWGLALGSDMKRAQYTMMRLERGLGAADLLIANRPYDLRPPDYTCACEEKHKWRRITNHCPILRRLHGAEAGAEYFAIRRDRRERKFFRMPVNGQVALSRIINS